VENLLSLSAAKYDLIQELPTPFARRTRRIVTRASIQPRRDFWPNCISQRTRSVAQRGGAGQGRSISSTTQSARSVLRILGCVTKVPVPRRISMSPAGAFGWLCGPSLQTDRQNLHQESSVGSASNGKFHAAMRRDLRFEYRISESD